MQQTQQPLWGQLAKSFLVAVGDVMTPLLSWDDLLPQDRQVCAKWSRAPLALCFTLSNGVAGHKLTKAALHTTGCK